MNYRVRTEKHKDKKAAAYPEEEERSRPSRDCETKTDKWPRLTLARGPASAGSKIGGQGRDNTAQELSRAQYYSRTQRKNPVVYPVSRLAFRARFPCPYAGRRRGGKPRLPSGDASSGNAPPWEQGREEVMVPSPLLKAEKPLTLEF